MRPSSTPLSLDPAALRLHPRVAYQGLYTEDADRQRLLARMPTLVPFRKRYVGTLVIVDWDHRLPSRKIAVRVLCYYDDLALAAGQEAYDDRVEEIGSRDRFPEFDVPDFADMPADEAYEIELEADGDLCSSRLTSSWRRDVDEKEGERALAIVRASAELAKILASTGTRPRGLGDLEVVSWTPPCESGHPRWTLDVWYLTGFDGRIGTGRSLLVDLDDKKVVLVRDFSVRAG